MPAGSKKSRTLRKVFVRTPGSKTVVQYKKRCPSKHACGACGRVLSGTVNLLVAKMRNITKTQKRPTRPFGGVLCSPCSKFVNALKAKEDIFESKSE